MHSPLPLGDKPMGLEQFLERLKHEERWASCVTAWKTLPAQEADYAPLPEGLDARLADALAARGINRLYSHQAAAFTSVADGQHTVVVTPTASGKTLCYNLPVLNTLLAEPEARA